MIPRWSLPCLVFLLLALGGAWSFRCAKMERVAAASAGIFGGEQGMRTGTMRDEGRECAFVAMSGGLDGGRQGAAVRVKPVASVGAGAMALLAEEIELRTMGEAVELALTEREWAAFAGVTLCHQAVRHAYEAEIAVATVLEDGRQRLEIPAYVGAGAVLRAEFYRALLKELGESAAMDVVRKLSQRLEGRFAGFGASVQTLDFSSDGSGGAWGATEVGSVTRTVVFWNEGDADEASRTRSETIFPQLEDPDGAQWGPLLARVETVAQVQGKKARG